MKNKCFIALLSLVLISGMALPVQAQQQLSPTATKVLFDWGPYEDKKMLDLFYTALQAGRNYPTREEIRNVFGFDLEFSRSHVRPRSVMYNQSKQLNPAIDPKRKLWMNIPSGKSKMGGGYPSNDFNNDVYSMWQYTHLFGSWNHSLFQAPGVWTDAAHKHGTAIYSGIKFFEYWSQGSTDHAYVAIITTKNPDGSFKYAEPMINALMYMGMDGINYNWEDASYSNQDVVMFHKELFRIAQEKGFDSFRIGLYTQRPALTNLNKDGLYYGHDPANKTIDLMLNYAGNDFAYSNSATSVGVAETVNPNDINVYQGVWIVTMNRSWVQMNADTRKKMNLVLWGEHANSRFWSFNDGPDALTHQENYQKLLERGFSGGNRTPANKPTLSNTGNNWVQEGTKAPLSTFGGLAHFVAERTTIQGKLPFWTNFQLGNGERYNYKGKKTFGAWYNMGAQDYVPTFRWLVYDAGTTNVSTAIQPDFTHRDAYTGGSMLTLSGTPTAGGTDIILYRTDLEISAANPKVTVAVKSLKEGENPTLLYVILRKKDDATWHEIPVGNTTAKTWQEVTLPMNGLTMGDHIEYIGLRVKGTSATPYQMYVGKLALTDDREVTNVSPVEDLIVEVKRETQNSMAVKLNWQVQPLQASTYAQQYGMVFNDECNISHFELMYKNGAQGHITEVGRTSGWAAYIGDLRFDDTDGADEPYIGVRAASIDGKNYSPVVWVPVPRAAAATLPDAISGDYCESAIDPDAEGIAIARTNRYVESATTTDLTANLAYSASGPGPVSENNYKDALDHSFTVEQGQQFNFFFKAADLNDGLKYCIVRGYIDWNQNGYFEASETVFEHGSSNTGTAAIQTTGVTKQITAPSDAHTGTTRMRMVFSDAWFPHPGACGMTAKGYSIDFSVNVTGNNPPAQVVTTHDEGQASEPDKVRPTLPDDIEKISANSASSFFPNPVESNVHFIHTQQVWIYTVDGKLVFTQKGNLETVDLSALDNGVYIVKMLNNSVVRSAKLQKR